MSDFQSSSKLIHRSFSAEYQKEPVRLKVRSCTMAGCCHALRIVMVIDLVGRMCRSLTPS